MSWIKVVEPDDADGKLKELYSQIQSPDGQIDNIMKVHSLRPRTLIAHLELYKAAIHSKPNALSPRVRQLVGVCVSLLNNCDSCVELHRAGLARHLNDEGLAQELTLAAVGEGDSENITPKERAMCVYAAKLTQSPGGMTAGDLTPLREVGLDDAAILDLNQLVAYFAYANRTVLGLGVNTTGEVLGLHPDENEEGFRHK